MANNEQIPEKDLLTSDDPTMVQVLTPSNFLILNEDGSSPVEVFVYQTTDEISENEMVKDHIQCNFYYIKTLFSSNFAYWFTSIIIIISNTLVRNLTLGVPLNQESQEERKVES